MPFLLQNSRNACHEMFQAGRKLRSSWRAIHGLRSWITWLFHGWFYMAGGVIILPCRKDFSANDLKIRGGCLVSITFLGSSHFHLWEISRHPFSKRNATDISCSQHDSKPYWHPSAWSKPSTRKWIKTWNTQPFCVEIIRTKKKYIWQHHTIWATWVYHKGHAKTQLPVIHLQECHLHKPTSVLLHFTRHFCELAICLHRIKKNSLFNRDPHPWNVHFF